MILGSSVVDNEFSDAQRAEAVASNTNMDTGIIEVPKKVDEASAVGIYEERNSEG